MKHEYYGVMFLLIKQGSVTCQETARFDYVSMKP